MEKEVCSIIIIMKKNEFFLLLLLFFTALLLRFSISKTPFWVDEFSTAEQAKLILNFGTDIFSQNINYFESNNILTHFLTAASFLLLGIGEWQARIPMIIIGAVVPIAIYLFTARNFNQVTALASSILYTFSYLQITWARQARGYVLQQLIIIVTLHLYLSLINNYSRIKFIFFIICCIFGLLTHTTFILIIISLSIHYIIFYRNRLITSQAWQFGLYATVITASIFFTGQLQSVIDSLKTLLLAHPNNLNYYHSFLWREQTIISLLAFIGTLLLVFKERKYQHASLLLIPVILFTFFVSFLFSPYVSRYLLPIFPILIILSGIAVNGISMIISNKRPLIYSLVVLIFILINGDKFVLKPKTFYSVNHDMREIALINYDDVYKLIKNKGSLDDRQTAVIDTWPDRMKWYLGHNQDNWYVFRWTNSPGLINGLAKFTPYEVNVYKEKFIPKTGSPPIKLIGDLSDLELVMSKYPRGFIWIDDSSLPQEVISYAEMNFKKELFLDRYSLDDNPYSIWPATLYSWGFSDDEK